jgi:hypothetical protein
MPHRPPRAPRPAPPRPFRWTLAGSGRTGRSGRIGALAAGAPPADLWYLDELTDCAAKVLARSGAGDLCFVGRSLDSMYDLLTGAVEDVPPRDRPGLRRLPVSGAGLWRGVPPEARARLCEHLAATGLRPYDLARRGRPVALVDVVHSGDTFALLHREIAAWAQESREPWPVIRRTLRYVGVTWRGRTSPHHPRWQQSGSHAWTRTLPAGNVVNVSLRGAVWGWLGNHQPKVHRSFPAERWFDEDAGRPPRHRALPQALAESLAVVAAGRTPEVRQALARGMLAEPAATDRAVRALAHRLRHAPRSRRRVSGGRRRRPAP